MRDDYPPERTAYAMRAPDRVVQQGREAGSERRPLRRTSAGGPLPVGEAAPGPEAAAAGRALHRRASGCRLRPSPGLRSAGGTPPRAHPGAGARPRGSTAPAARPARPATTAGRFARPGAAFDHRFAVHGQRHARRCRHERRSRSRASAQTAEAGPTAANAARATHARSCATAGLRRVPDAAAG